MTATAAAKPRPSTDPTMRQIGHGLAMLLGVASLAGGIAGLASGLPHVVGLTLLVSGVVLPVLALKSLGGSRPAWSFAVSVLAVLAVVTFFGAPKIRHVLHIDLWVAMIIPALHSAAVAALAKVRADYHP